MVQGVMRHDLYPELTAVEDEHWWHRQKRRFIHTLIKKYAPNKGKSLDVGCGGGKLIQELIALKWQAEGADYVTIEGRKRGLAIKKVNLQTQPLPFAANRFHLVTCLDTLEHMQSDRHLVKEMIRICRPGGIIIISVPAYQWLFSYWDKMLGHFRRYNSRLLEKTVKLAGVKLVFISYYFSYLLMPAIIIRSIKKLTGRQQQSDFTANPLPVFTFSVVDLLGRIEQSCFKFCRIPFGLSLVCVLKKK